MEKEAIGRRISGLLSERCLPQKDLAAAVGVHVNVVSYWCRSVRIPNIDQIVDIAKFFGVTTDYLLGLTDVAAPDMDMQALCRKTRLTKESADNLMWIMTAQDYPGDDGDAAAVNAMLSSRNGMTRLVSAIRGLMENIPIAEDYLSDGDSNKRILGRDLRIGNLIDVMELDFFRADKAFRYAVDEALGYQNIIDRLTEREG